MNCSKLNSISYHAQSSPIVSLHAQFTVVSYHLPHEPFPISQLAPRPWVGENVNIPVDRSERDVQQTHTIYIGRVHARVVKESGEEVRARRQEIAEKFTKRMEFLAISGSA